jgi:hypothetical protein
MNKEAVINWMKSNPLIVACLAIMVVCLLSFYYPSHVWGEQFRQELQSRESLIAEINAFKTSQVKVPPARPEDPPTEINTVINAETVDRLRNVYQQMESEYLRIYDLATKHNRAGHEPMLQGLFPTPAEDSRQFEARAAYIKGITGLYQTLKAGPGPEKSVVDAVLAREEENFRRAQFAPNALTPQQADELAKRQADAVQKLYQEYASRVHIFAPTVALEGGSWTPGAFQVGDWARAAAGVKPSMADIWEGQLQLWIQQDLVDAIAIANKATDANESVRTAPVKRLLAMFVKPGYIGLTGDRIDPAAAATPNPGDPNAPAASPDQQTQAVDVNQPLAYDFALSPTGRKSNHIYDVRHAVLSVIVDSRKIPDLLNAIAAVNFMTVIGIETKDVDEYADLREGFYYGRAVDAVRLDLTIETIWLRSWTAGHDSEAAAAELKPPQPFNRGLMPNDVRRALKLTPRDAGGTPVPAPGSAPAAPKQ